VQGCSERGVTLRRWTSRVAVATGFAAGLASQSPAWASNEYPGDIEGKKRAHFELEALYWVGAITLPRQGNALRIDNEAVGVFGHPRFPLNLGLGYGLTENLVVGARVDFSADMRDDLAHPGVTIRSAISPYVELMFLRDRHVRPFAHLRAGLGGGRTFVRVPEQRALESTGASILYPLIGLGLGAHVFLSEEVSFDAMVGVEHRWNVRRQGAAVRTAVEDVEIGRWRLLDTSFSAVFSFGFSRWF
jgi:hypothetical protein